MSVLQGMLHLTENLATEHTACPNGSGRGEKELIKDSLKDSSAIFVAKGRGSR
jgi:hypothetical protein